MIIYLYCRLPDSSHATAWRDVPGDTTGRRIVSCFVLLRMGFTQPPHVTVGAVVSYTAIPPLPQTSLRRFLFCCTFLRVASTGRYPASCPMKPGLSSPVLLQPRSFILLTQFYILTYKLRFIKSTHPFFLPVIMLYFLLKSKFS